MPFTLASTTDPTELLDGLLLSTRSLAATLCMIASGDGRAAFDDMTDETREAIMLGLWAQAEDAAALARAVHDGRRRFRP